MEIIINYDSSWHNSFLDGEANAPHFNEKGKYKQRKWLTTLYNFTKNGIKKADISKNTALGILYRLIGDQRRLFQIMLDESRYFADIEGIISFTDSKDYINGEITILKNMNFYAKNPSSYKGILHFDRPCFNETIYKKLWQVFWLDSEQLYDFIVNKKELDGNIGKVDPNIISAKLEICKKVKLSDIICQNIVEEFKKSGIEIFKDNIHLYKIYKKGEESGYNVFAIYCAALYIAMKRLEVNSITLDDVKNEKNKGKVGGEIVGFSLRTHTPRTFYGHNSGGEVMNYRCPTVCEKIIKGQGSIQHRMKKSGGKLSINIPCEYNKAVVIATQIKNAGVNSFYVGKKGLAYVEDIIY